MFQKVFAKYEASRGYEARILQYHVSLRDVDQAKKSINYRNRGNFSTAGFSVVLNRRLAPYLNNSFCPTFILVLISWISFFIPAESIPGRMAVLVTVFLMLVNIGNTSDQTNPKAKVPTAMDIWIRSCMVFVAAALFEYAIVLNKLFSSQRKKVHGIKGRSTDDVKALEKIDCYTLKSLVVTYTLFNISYWIYYTAQKPE